MNLSIPFAFAQQNKIYYDVDSNNIVHSQATDFSMVVEVSRFAEQPQNIVELTAEEFDQQLNEYYAESRSSAAQAMDEMDDFDLQDASLQVEKEGDLLENDNAAPIIRLLNSIFFEALKKQASDIHIESYEEIARVRYRINGVLTTVLSPPQKIVPLLISRIKVLAKLDIAEKRIPQDGRMSVLLGGRQVDLRVSTLPSSFGERAVLRLLDKQGAKITVEKLGMEQDNVKRLEEVIERPHGIILVTGPTGSGKTTTLYAALQKMDRLTRNIMTVEDPIEYDLPGISQTHVNVKTGMTFAKSLRALLRQDPDVILIGEIRDQETAEIAVQASLTGHLVLATLHTNTAIGAITRLRDLHIDGFLLSSTVRAILAQRLVRTVCQHCCTKTDNDIIPNGCEHCANSGYEGRRGIFELITVDPELQKLIHQDASEPIIEKYVRKSTPSIIDDGMSLVSKGITTEAEIRRVTSV